MIRPAVEKDSDILTTISFASKGYWNYPEGYFEIWKSKLTISEEYIQKNDVFVYEIGTSVIGYYSVVNLEDDIKISDITVKKGAWLEHMFIEPLNIGKGIGTKLFDHMRKWCFGSGIREIGILADPNSRGFYEKMGCIYLQEYPSTIEGRTTPYLQYYAETLTNHWC